MNEETHLWSVCEVEALEVLPSPKYVQQSKRDLSWSGLV